MTTDVQTKNRSLPPWVWILVALWLAYWLIATRYAMLDDALIHLRYAAHLHDLHRITYDGVHVSYGTSSLLYVTLLAILRGVSQSALLPKAVSSVCYLLLVLFLILLGRRFATRTGPYAIWLGLLLASLSPMAIRWFTDGMETSLVVLAVSLFAWEAERESHATAVTPASYLLHLLVGALIVLLRVELACVAAFATCALFLGSMARADRRTRWLRLIGSTAFALGAVLAMAAIRILMGNVLPDTAVAKSSSTLSLAPLGSAAHVILSSILLGIGATLLAFLSAIFYLRELLKQRSAKTGYLVWLCANGCFPLIVFLACLRGQAVQGIRYLLWTLFFAIVWNALAWERLRQQQPKSGSQPGSALMRNAAWICAALFLCVLPFDWHYAAHAMAGRANTFLTMRSAGLERYRGNTLIAGDVGFIGYFTDADVCDLAGLVNGRQIAMLGPEERIDRCASRHPQVLFVSALQAWRVAQRMPLTDWVICQPFDFDNVIGNDRHYLMVPMAAKPYACPASGYKAGPPY